MMDASTPGDGSVALLRGIHPRAVSAVRRWPPGCGRLPALPQPPTSAQTEMAAAPAAEAEAVESVRQEAGEVGSAIPPVQSPPETIPPDVDKVWPVDDAANSVANAQLDDGGLEGLPVDSAVKSDANGQLDDDGLEELTIAEENGAQLVVIADVYRPWLAPKVYGPLKRRDVSAVRTFPKGCGRSESPSAAAANGFVDAVYAPAMDTVMEDTKLLVKDQIIDGGRTSSVTKLNRNPGGFSSVASAKKAKRKQFDEKVPLADRPRSEVASGKGKGALDVHGYDRRSDGRFFAESVKTIRSEAARNNPKISDSKQKISKESEDGTSDEDEYIDDDLNRPILQGLMTPSKCIWMKESSVRKPISAKPLRDGKQIAGVSSRNLHKSKLNKGKKPMKSLPGERVISVQKMISAPRDEDANSLNSDDGEEDDNSMALAVYSSGNKSERKRNLSINLTPSVPYQLASGQPADARGKVRRLLKLYQAIFRRLLQTEEASADGPRARKLKRIDLMAFKIIKESREYIEYFGLGPKSKIIGAIPGVEVGDEFHYRVELALVGLHAPFQGGIDTVKWNDTNIALSIVSSGGYSDDLTSSDILTYTGSGGKPEGGKDAEDQKLHRGNLALCNSINARQPVRVIHGFKVRLPQGRGTRKRDIKEGMMFTYGGLYMVEDFWEQIGDHGKKVFKFQMRRLPGQPELSLHELQRDKNSTREGLIINNLAGNQENWPIPVFNTVDDERPPLFKYITKIIYPSWYSPQSPVGCDCRTNCSDSGNCACALKNGGEIPYNHNGAIVQAKPLIYECGPNCRCSKFCHNRVSQHGIQISLEVFKTKDRGWGVRSLDSIASGTFICEYVGELLQDKEAEQRSNDEYLFDIGHNYDDQDLWEGLPSLIPGLRAQAPGENVESEGFTIDAVNCGNVGRFINHSCSPNLYAQNVLFDHDDTRMPHIMFFAAENIPPLQELTYHYNYTIGQVRDEDGNIKEKYCYCGSSECTGRLY